MDSNREQKFYSFIENIAIVFLSLTILPFIILSFYSHPSWDDYQFYAVTAESGYINAQIFWYKIWTGAFFSIALLNLFNPLVYGSMFGYKLLGVILIFGFLVSCYYMVREFTQGSTSKKVAIICALAFTSLYFFKMSNVSFGFYWMASSFKYGVPNLLFMILLTYMMKFFREDDNKKKFRQKIVIYFLLIAIAGCSEVSMVLLLAALYSFLVIYFLTEKKINRQLMYFTIVSTLAALVVYMSPGNFNRAADFPKSGQFVNSVINAGTDLVKFIPYRLLDTPLLLLTLLFIPLCVKLISEKKLNHHFIKVNPFYTVSAFLLTLFSGFFTTYWSLGEGPYDRTVNVVYFAFLIGWFVNVLIIVNYIMTKYEFKYYPLPKYVVIIACLLIVFSYRKDNNVKLAYKDLASGTAAAYDSELQDRYNQLYESKSDTAIVQKLKSPIPKTFFYYDEGPDPDFKYNRYKEMYFNKKAYIVIGDSSDVSKDDTK